jgi:hypothetical protein
LSQLRGVPAHCQYPGQHLQETTPAAGA